MTQHDDKRRRLLGRLRRQLAYTAPVLAQSRAPVPCAGAMPAPGALPADAERLPRWQCPVAARTRHHLR